MEAKSEFDEMFKRFGNYSTCENSINPIFELTVLIAHKILPRA